MRVRVQTSPLGMCLRILSLLVLGGVAAIVTEHSEWFQTVKATQQQTAVPQPSPAPAPAPVPAPKPSTVKLAAPLPAHTTPPGWSNIGGIMLPPPGYNDTQ
jgi:hypothetical protein